MRRSTGALLFDSVNTGLMVILALITVYPMIYVIFASLSDPRLLATFQGLLVAPLGSPTLRGYEITLRNPNIMNGYRNTLFYVGFGTTLNLIMTSLCAFVLSRKDFYIKKVMMVMIVITMFFTGGLIPLFFVVRNLGMYDRPWAVIFPVAINTWNMIIMRTFFMSIPDSLQESATMDGANDLVVFTRIVLPLSMPVIAVMVLYYGVAHWNSWFSAMVFLRNRRLFPLQLFLREILILATGTSTAETGAEMMEESLYNELVRYCTIVVSTVPILSIYPFLQKYFVKGVMIGALKG